MNTKQHDLQKFHSLGELEDIIQDGAMGNDLQNDWQEVFSRVSGIIQASLQAIREQTQRAFQPLLNGELLPSDTFQSVNEHLLGVVQPLQDFMEQDRLHINAYFALLRIIRKAKDDPEIKESSEIMAIVDRLIDMFESASLSKYKDINLIMSFIEEESQRALEESERNLKKIKDKIAMNARKAGKSSAEERRNIAKERNSEIRSEAEELKKNHEQREIAGILARKKFLDVSTIRKILKKQD